jgi:hypothetical protein
VGDISGPLRAGSSHRFLRSTNTSSSWQNLLFRFCRITNSLSGSNIPGPIKLECPASFVPAEIYAFAPGSARTERPVKPLAISCQRMNRCLPRSLSWNRRRAARATQSPGRTIAANRGRALVPMFSTNPCSMLFCMTEHALQAKRRCNSMALHSEQDCRSRVMGQLATKVALFM